MFGVIVKKLDTEEFIRRAKEVHEDRYDYSKSVYKDLTTPISIICKVHGEFKTNPYNHTKKKTSCPSCNHDKYKMTYDSFLSKAKEIHGDKYIYSEVKFNSSKVKITILCKDHGKFDQTPQDHLAGKGCTYCRSDRSRKSTEQFIEQSQQIHGNVFDYSLVNYTRSQDNVQIICGRHGVFEQSPKNHLINTTGCRICQLENQAQGSHWDYLTRVQLNKLSGNNSAILYLIELRRKHEIFLKIGVSSRLPTRLKMYHKEGFEYKLLRSKEYTAKEVALKERSFLIEIKKHNYKYTPVNKFAGWTECANISHKEELLELFDKMNL
jgi:hypothetical protein